MVKMLLELKDSEKGSQGGVFRRVSSSSRCSDRAMAPPRQLAAVPSPGLRCSREGDKKATEALLSLSPSREQRRPGEGTAASWRGGAMARDRKSVV